MNVRIPQTLIFSLTLASILSFATANGKECFVSTVPLSEAELASLQIQRSKLGNWFDCRRDEIFENDGVELRKRLLDVQEQWLNGKPGQSLYLLRLLREKSQTWQLSPSDRCGLAHAFLRLASITDDAIEAEEAIQTAALRGGDCQIDPLIIPPEIGNRFAQKQPLHLNESLPAPKPFLGRSVWLENGSYSESEGPKNFPKTRLHINFVGGTCQTPQIVQTFTFPLLVIFSKACARKYHNGVWSKPLALTLPSIDLLPTQPGMPAPLPLPPEPTEPSWIQRNQGILWIGLSAIAAGLVISHNQRQVGVENQPSHTIGF